MIERIDTFMPPKSPYQLLHYFTVQLSAALRRSGVKCRVLEAQRDNPKQFLEMLFKDNPECTLSFNGLLPDNEGNFFCDLIRIPHVACLMDPPHHFVALTHSAYSIITTNDWDAYDFFEGLNFRQVLFMAPGVDVNLINKPLSLQEKEREYDILVLSTFIDVEAIRDGWKKNHNKSLYSALEDAAENILGDQSISVAQAFAEALDRQMSKSQDFDPHAIDVLSAFDQLERYVNGIDRMGLVEAVNCAKVHLFGVGSHQWKKQMGKKGEHVIAHDPVNFEEALELMKRSKILLSSTAALKNGAHERVLSGIACGSYVLSNENLYMKENFQHGEGVSFYRPRHWEEANNQVEKLLKNEKKRWELIDQGREIIKDGHTWDHRAATLLSEIGPILAKMQEKV